MDRWNNRDRDWRYGRDPRDFDRPVDRGSHRGRDDRDWGWRGTELDRGFAGGYGYDRGPDRHDGRGRYENRDYGRDHYNRGNFDRPDYDRGNYGRGDYDRGDDYGMMRRDFRRDVGRAPRDFHDGHDDRYRYASGDPYMDRGYERARDDRDFRDREYGRDYWDDYPWSRGRGW